MQRIAPFVLAAAFLSGPAFSVSALAASEVPQPPHPSAAAPREAADSVVPVSDAEDSRWSRTLERVATGVVTIQVDLTRAFDTERNMSSQATGFVVDAQRGLMLTNSHVVTPGPV